jgi:hypothetical protein
MRIFGSERLDKVLSTLGMKEGEAIVHPWVNKSLEKAQAKVEARNFDIRKQLLKFDDVMNDQRKVIFGQRLEIMERRGSGRDRARHAPSGDRRSGRHPHAAQILCRPVGYRGLQPRLCDRKAGMEVPVGDWAEEDGVDQDEVRERLYEASTSSWPKRPSSSAPRRCADRKAASAADDRRQVARASADARTSALGRGLPRLCAARSAERIQDRGLPAVRERCSNSLREDVTQKLPRSAR